MSLAAVVLLWRGTVRVVDCALVGAGLALLWPRHLESVDTCFERTAAAA
jgi:hypothetical protein